MPSFKKYTFECTNGGGFHGGPGNTIVVEDRGAAWLWHGGGSFLDATSGTVGFSPEGLILERLGGGAVAEIVLRKKGDQFDRVTLISYVHGIRVYKPKKGVSPVGWRWRLIDRI